MKQCNVCRSGLKQTTVTYTQQYQGRFVMIENVPAWSCEQCGEVFYDPDIVERVQNLIWSGAAPVRFIETPVYDLSVYP